MAPSCPLSTLLSYTSYIPSGAFIKLFWYFCLKWIHFFFRKTTFLISHHPDPNHGISTQRACVPQISVASETHLLLSALVLPSSQKTATFKPFLKASLFDFASLTPNQTSSDLHFSHSLCNYVLANSNLRKLKPCCTHLYKSSHLSRASTFECNCCFYYFIQSSPGFLSSLRMKYTVWRRKEKHGQTTTIKIKMM